MLPEGKPSVGKQSSSVTINGGSYMRVPVFLYLLNELYRFFVAWISCPELKVNYSY